MSGAEAVSIILRIFSDGRVHNMKEIKDKLDKSERQIRRYIADMRSSDFPIDPVLGKDKEKQGYRLMGELRLTPDQSTVIRKAMNDLIEKNTDAHLAREILLKFHL